MINALFVNHGEKACGVQQIGKRIAGMLAGSARYRIVYLEAGTPRQILEAANANQTLIVIYNYYPATLGFVDVPFTAYLRSRGIRQYGIFHDPITPAYIELVDILFDGWMIHDQTTTTARGKKFKTCRPIPRFAPAALPEKLSFGSRGFGISTWKSFDTIVAAVDREF